MLVAEKLSKRWHSNGREVVALDQVSLSLSPGEIVCIAGRSGAGKSTLLKCMLGLVAPDNGSVQLDGEDLYSMTPAQRRRFCQAVAPVMQDPAASLPPRMRIAAALSEPLRIQQQMRGPLHQQVTDALCMVELKADIAQRYPHELSGGQQQRVAIARAVIGRPRFILADEPTSALDVVTAMRIAKLLRDLVDRLDLGLLVISHDPKLAWHLGAHVARLEQGRIIERAAADQWMQRARARWATLTGASA